MTWHPHTETPPIGMAVIIAYRDDGEGDYLHNGLVIYARGDWRDPEGDVLDLGPLFFWMLETDLLATLPE